jgi:DNA-binding NarL/FixJ family response regulator
MSENASGPAADPSGLLLSRDLIFTTKVTGTARALGRRVATAGSPDAVRSLIERERPSAVFVDLSAGDLVAPEALRSYRELAGPGTPFVAFGSHVDTRALDLAREAGCDPVLPRSRFTAELPELIRRLIPGPPP